MTASLAVVQAGVASAAFTIQQGFVIGPNGASGSPSFPAWQLNAIQGLQGGFVDVGNFNNDPTAFHLISSASVRDIVSTNDFTSWRGVASPTGAFANELGNLLYDPVHISGNGTKFSLSQVVVTNDSSDNISNPANSLLGNVLDLKDFNYSPGRVGVVHHAGGADTFITSGSPDQLVDELYYRGVGSYDTLLNVTGSGLTGQQVIDNELARLSAFGNLTFTSNYAIYKDNTSRDAASILFSDTNSLRISAVPEPSSLAMLGIGAATLLAARRRRRRPAPSA